MVLYENILIPTDGSKNAEVAVEHAVQIAEKFDATAHVLYVIDTRVKTSGDIWTNMLGELEDIGERATESIAGQINEKELKSVKNVTDGIPHKEIIDYAKEKDIDLIVMGTQGRTGLDRILVGSTAENVIRNSEVPVMTVRREA